MTTIDELTDLLLDVQEKLERAEPRVTGEVPLRPGEHGRWLAFCKVGEEWCLAIRLGVEADKSCASSWTRLANASMKDRADAAHQLPALLKVLEAKRSQVEGSIDVAAAKVKEVLHALDKGKASR